MTDRGMRISIACVGLVAGLFIWAVVDATLLNRDVAALMSLSERMLAGFSVNDPLAPKEPPFALFVYAIPVLIGKALPFLGLAGATTVFITFVGAASLSLGWQELQVLAGKRLPLAASFLIFAIAALPVLLEWHVVAQREHLAFILILPWLLTRFAEFAGIAPARGAGHLVVISAMAAVGFCVKPLLSVLFVAIECLGVLTCRRLFAWVRMDSLIIGGLGLGYMVLWYILYPAYFVDIGYYVETIAAADLRRQVLAHLILMALAILGTTAVVALVPAKNGRIPSLAAILLSVVCAGLFLLQGRPFPQQIYLVYAFLGLALAVGASGGRLVFPAVLCICTAWLAFHPSVSAIGKSPPRIEALRKAVDQLRPHIEGQTVTVLSVNVFPAWPIINEAQARFDGPLRNLYYLTVPSGIEEQPFKPYLRGLITRYIAERKPPYILVLDRVEGATRLDPLADLSRLPAFRSSFSCYRRIVTATEISTGRFRFHPQLYRRMQTCNT